MSDTVETTKPRLGRKWAVTVLLLGLLAGLASQICLAIGL